MDHKNKDKKKYSVITSIWLQGKEKARIKISTVSIDQFSEYKHNDLCQHVWKGNKIFDMLFFSCFDKRVIMHKMLLESLAIDRFMWSFDKVMVVMMREAWWRLVKPCGSTSEVSFNHLFSGSKSTLMRSVDVPVDGWWGWGIEPNWMLSARHASFISVV